VRRRFFVEQFNADRAVLTGDSAAHLGRVLRAEPGQLCELSDGSRVWLARIERVELPKRGDDRVEFALVEPVEAREGRARIRLLLALVKFDRFEWALEKATELGVAEIVPLTAARSDKPLLAAAEKRLDRWRKILLESAQQSRRLRIPRIRAAVAPAAAFAAEDAGLKILLSERPGAAPLRDALARAANPEAAIAIGPEGGWTDEELAAGRAGGFAEASLGENILRTETAVTAALAILSFALEPLAR